MNDLFRSENATRQMPLMQLKVKLQKTAENSCLKGKKTTNKVRTNIFSGLKE